MNDNVGNRNKITIIYGENSTGKTKAFELIKAQSKNLDNKFVSIEDVKSIDDQNFIFYSDSFILNNECFNFLESVAQHQQKSQGLNLFSAAEIKKIKLLIGFDAIDFVYGLINFETKYLSMPLRSIIEDDEKYLSVWEDASKFSSQTQEKIIEHAIVQQIKKEIKPWQTWENKLFEIKFKTLEPLLDDEISSSIYKELCNYTPLQLKSNIGKLKTERLKYDKLLLTKNSFMETINSVFSLEFSKIISKINKLKFKYSDEQKTFIAQEFFESLTVGNESFENLKLSIGDKKYGFSIESIDNNFSRGQKAIILLIKNLMEAKYE